MSLSTGEKLGPYLILEKIGAGGMGEVYRCRDERLGRDVALKVSAERFSERFEREAKLIASLNHNNICSIFDVGPNFLVMELIEGPTLAERIEEGPLPLDEALPIALQIADALQAAHDSGIVHRDLKPGNIKLRKDGTAKVLDFGLAKSGAADASPSLTNSPTMLQATATQAGVIMGTAAYMSPEQARGKSVDKRADIWAFGVVLHEMLSGKNMFRGEDVTQTLASVIMKDPDLEVVPAKVRHVLKRCLDKDPNRRLRDISGVSLLLDHEPGTETPVVQEAAQTSGVWRIVALAALAFAAILLIGLYRSRPEPSILRPLVRLNVDLGPKAVFTTSAISGASAVLSPDGKRLLFIAQSRLFIKSLDRDDTTEVPGTVGTFAAIFSPDSLWIAYFSGGKLRKVPVEGGAAITLADLTLGRGAVWGEDGQIIFASGSTGVLLKIPDGGGTPVQFTNFERGEITHRWPAIVPGGNAVVYTAHSNTTNFDTATIRLRTADGKTKVIQQGGTAARIVKTPRGNAYLLYVTRGILFARPFDLTKMEPHGDTFAMVDDIGSTPSGAAEYDVSTDGILIYRKTGGGLMTLQVVDPSGKLTPIIATPGVYGRPNASRVDDRIAIETSSGAGSEVSVFDPRGDKLSKLTFDGQNAGPVFSPDGTYIVYQTPHGISWIPSAGGTPKELVKTKGLVFPSTFSPNGRHLSYMENGSGGYDIDVVTIEGNVASRLTAGPPQVVLATNADERAPAFSPDGKWLAYSSNESGTFEVYVRAFPDTGAKWQVSNGGGNYPKWSEATHELIFETAEATMMAASYSFNGNSFVSEKQRPWSPRPLLNLVNSIRNFDLLRDGKRIVALMPDEGPEQAAMQSHVKFLLNFFDELDRKLAGK